MPHSLTFTAELKNLPVLRRFVSEISSKYQARREVIDGLIQAVDESATNIIVHGYQGRPGKIEIQMTLEEDSLVVRLWDQAPLFDPTQIPPPNLALPLEERRFGGLGVHLARHFTDQMTYQVTPDGNNELTLRKKINPNNPSPG